jgi:hypothetical protein
VRPSRSLATGVAVWLLVVAVGSAVVWAVISRAGEGVVSSEAPVTPATEQPEQPEQPERPGETDDPTQSASTDPTAGPTGPSSAPPADGPPDPEPVRRTWVGVGGQVTVECQGSAASLASLIADSGFGFEIDDRGPDRVRVEFEGRGDNDDQRSRIESWCADGIPTFETDER